MASAMVCALALGAGLTINSACDNGPGEGARKPSHMWDLPETEKPRPVQMPPFVLYKDPPQQVAVAPPPPPPVQTPPPQEPPPKESAVRSHILSLWQTRPRPLTLSAYRTAYGNGAAPLPAVQDTIADLPPMPLPAMLRPPKEDYKGPRRQGTGPVDNTRIVTTDRIVHGVLETSIHSELLEPGRNGIIIQTTRPVVGAHGRTVLIPVGSRFVCNGAPPRGMGSARLDIVCDRLLLAGSRAEIRNLDSLVFDAQGRDGVSGAVDQRFIERYGTAFALTGISTGVRLATALTQTGDGHPSASQQASELAASELSTQLGEITATSLKKAMSLKPIITVPQGTRVLVRPRTEWVIPELKQAATHRKPKT